MANFCRLPADVLQKKLCEALLAQKEALVQREGGGTALERELDRELAWAQKINTDAADKMAARWIRKWDIGSRWEQEPDESAFA
mmetsp:Transcript_17375/g.66178  ORF Transcript_17375/g.66178 Transcript_17375/m.66178 type:complete len:84 (-) Transcript_17375:42-293(-)